MASQIKKCNFGKIALVKYFQVFYFVKIKCACENTEMRVVVATVLKSIKANYGI